MTLEDACSDATGASMPGSGTQASDGSVTAFDRAARVGPPRRRLAGRLARNATVIFATVVATLTLMFVIAAIESHHHEEGEMGHEAMEAVHDASHLPAPSAAH